VNCLTFSRSALALSLICLTLALPSSSGAQTPKDFQSPPDSARPLTWWHWVSGNVTEVGINADLQAMKQIGLGGAQIFSVNQGPPGPVRYMSPQWRTLVQDAITRAHQLGLKLSITDCEGWSESGGPWITPELSMQKVVWTETSAQGGQASPITLAQPENYQGYYRDIVVLAFPSVPDSARITNAAAKAGFSASSNTYEVDSADPDIPASMTIDPAKILDLSPNMSPDGTLSWNPPAGSWTILRFGMTSTGTPIHPAMPETSGLECDKLSRAAVTANWNGAMAHVIADSGASAGHTLGTVLMDSWEAGTGNWTPLMRQDFQKRRGYDLTLWMPALTGRVVGSTDQTERFLWDYRRTMADLVAENHYGLIQSLAHAHGMQLQAEAVGIGMPTVADQLLCKGYTDVPMGEFWIGNPGTLTDDKEAASAAHIYGKTYVAAESFTSTPDNASWTNDPYSLKVLGDDAFCSGVNKYSFHRYAMQPYLNRVPGMTMGPWGLNFERTNTWWVPGKAWITYITRCQSLLQQGKFVGDVCYFYGEGAPQAVGSFHFSPAPPAGYDYDVCNADVILHRMSVKNGLIVLPDGMSYRVLVLPDDTRLTPEIVAKVRDLVAQGATVVGPKPVASPSLSDYPNSDTAIKTAAEQVWGNCNGTSVTRHSFGKGQVIWGESLDHVLSSAGPDFSYNTQTANAQIKYIHRLVGDRDCYFVSNQTYAPVDAVCTFRVTNKTPEFWWPDTGKIEPVALYKVNPSRVAVPIHLSSAGSVFVVFRHSENPGAHIETAKAVNVAPVPVPPVHHVVIQNAVYGVGGDVDVTAAVAEWVRSGEPSQTVNNNLSGGTDPDVNVVKRLQVDYTVDGKPYTATISENSPLLLPDAPAGGPARQANVRIVKAMYGMQGILIDVTDRVAALSANGSLPFLVSNDLVNGNDPAFKVAKHLTVSYTVDGALHRKNAAEGQSVTLVESHLDVPPVFETAFGQDGKPGLNVWRDGTYVDQLSSGAVKTLRVLHVPAPVDIKGTWNLNFPAGWGAPAHINLDHLKSWTTIPDDGVKYFSGTATYSIQFQVSPSQLGPDKTLYLDLGIVKNLADVTVNGKDLGVLWKEPFQIDITSAAVVGTNSLTVKVTNLWPNRLIGDAFLPPAKRYTWTTSSPYNQSSELLDSGLLGPVVLRTSVWESLTDK